MPAGGGSGGGGAKPAAGTATDASKLNLSADQVHVVKLYTGGYSGNMNNMLRSGQSNSFIQGRVDKLNQVFDAAPALTHNIEVGRIVMDAHKMFGPVGSNVGGTFTDRGFVSTSTPGGSYNPATGQQSNIRILVPAGAKAIDVKSLSVNPSENEVLLPSGSSFKITKDTVNDSGTRQLEMTMIVK